MKDLLNLIHATGGDRDLERKLIEHGSLYDRETRVDIKRSQSSRGVKTVTPRGVYNLLRARGPLTPEQIREYLDYKDVSSVRKKITELVRMGAVVCVSPPSRQQRRSAVWEAVPYEFD